MNPQQYFAALPPDELSDELMERVIRYYADLDACGMLRKLRKSYSMYYGGSLQGMFSSSSDVGYGGDQGELALVKVNHYRNLITHVLVMTTQSRPALEARASNTDMKSQAQTILANGILDYYMREKRMERFLKTAVEHALIFAEGYVHMEWDVTAGNTFAVDPDSGEQIKEGDIKYSNPLGPLEVIKDTTLTSAADANWYIVASTANKFDLAAQYPHLADKIIALSRRELSTQTETTTTFMPQSQQDASSDSLIRMYKFYHRRTPAVPEGREFVFLDGGLWLLDAPLPHRDLPGGLPLFRISPADFYGTSFGYTPAWDAIGLQEVIDSLHSAVTTNQTSFAVQNILVPMGHNINVQQLSGGLNIIEYDPQLGEPKALNLVSTPPEVFKYIDMLKQEQQLLLAVNDVVRGDPQASLKSGSALALVASQAIQFNSGLQASYTALLEDVGTGTIKMLQTFANTKRVASIAGKSQRYMLAEFSSEDIDQISRVIVDVANPLARTLQGRVGMAQDLLQIPGAGVTPEQYLQVVQTGKLEPMTEGRTAELMTVRSENELLATGQMTPIAITDDHILHIKEHKAVIADPAARKDPNVLQASLNHIQDHLDALRNTDPGLLMILGQQPIPPAMPMMQPPMPGQPPMEGQAPDMGAMLNPTDPTTQQAGAISEPRMPTIAGTDQQFTPGINPNQGI
jgi:hypothetical protein